MIHSLNTKMVQRIKKRRISYCYICFLFDFTEIDSSCL